MGVWVGWVCGGGSEGSDDPLNKKNERKLIIKQWLGLRMQENQFSRTSVLNFSMGRPPRTPKEQHILHLIS